MAQPLIGNRSTWTRRFTAWCAAVVCAAAVIGLGTTRLASAQGERNHNEGPQRILQARVVGDDLIIRLDRLGSRVPGVWLADQQMAISALDVVGVRQRGRRCCRTGC